MNKREFFPVLSIERDDINHAIGYALGPDLADDQMREIASKFNDVLQALEPWNILADMILTDVVESLYGNKPGTITIEVESGVITAVTGLPENYQYEVLDHDVKEPQANTGGV